MSDAANTTWLRKPTLPPRVKIFFPRTDESESGASKSPRSHGSELPTQP
eukprot:CAMPEP_0181354610 /NCGR_PEP_ID=MMETSP1106-20121128/3450_1 /TAXON_ID=81844 /ORGANISM="Mantoniella antarctica, Strain SL-175" /LENGTH=48 /DNA_ID= /DNA_START= /DNA_END= /DNA_ORIENTATION=